MTSKGLAVDKSKSGGLGIGEYWVKLLVENEQAFVEGRGEDVLEDSDLTVVMCRVFANHAASKIFKDVVRVRSRYNRGALAGAQTMAPEIKSHRYKRLGDGGVQRATARGRLLPEKCSARPPQTKARKKETRPKKAKQES